LVIEVRPLEEDVTPVSVRRPAPAAEHARAGRARAGMRVGIEDEPTSQAGTPERLF
jgi:hypothetical protein